MSLDKTEQINRLADIYASLLSARQRELILLYFGEDYSLAEIAELYQISRQAVHDALQRAVHTMESYEATLHLLELHQQKEFLCDAVNDLLKVLPRELYESPEAVSVRNAMDTGRMVQVVVDQS